MLKRALPLLFAALGAAGVVWLIAHEGLAEILALLATAGWALLWLIPYHLVALALDAEGWRALLAQADPARRASRLFLTWVATVREAMNRLLPVASVGGEIVGIRLVVLRGLPGPAVSGSVVVEVLLTIVNQYLFTAMGLALMLTGANDPNLAWKLLGGLAATVPVPLALYWLLRHGRVFERVERFLIGLLGEEAGAKALFGDAGKLDHEIRALFAQPRALAGGLFWQLLGMVLNAFEVWFVLWLLGHEVSIATAIGIESLVLAVRHFAFFVPGGLGVQEASLVIFGNLAGLPAEVSVALSLAKRVRELGLGIPSLLSWQWIEGRQWLLRRREERVADEGTASGR